ncbi:MAG TPA: hypothetical protein VFE14_19195, partial [Micromonosporaceae bacterium]|nr:hypothetical protein [Micromonosporaceae bacterium]
MSDEPQPAPPPEAAPPPPAPATAPPPAAPPPAAPPPDRGGLFRMAAVGAAGLVLGGVLGAGAA